MVPVEQQQTAKRLVLANVVVHLDSWSIENTVTSGQRDSVSFPVFILEIS